jgi:hypothetical protein
MGNSGYVRKDGVINGYGFIIGREYRGSEIQ